MLIEGERAGVGKKSRKM